MTAWLCEKSSRTCQEIALFAEYVRGKTEISDEIRDEINYRLNSIAHNIVMIMAFAAGAEIDSKDKWKILQEGHDGFQEIAFKYGLLYKTDKQKFIDELKALLVGESVPNRTLIHELLRRTERNDLPLFEEIANQIEKVTMGQMDWNSFKANMKNLIERYEFENNKDEL